MLYYCRLWNIILHVVDYGRFGPPLDIPGTGCEVQRAEGLGDVALSLAFLLGV